MAPASGSGGYDDAYVHVVPARLKFSERSRCRTSPAICARAHIRLAGLAVRSLWRTKTRGFPVQNTVITGATGFVGGELLAKLLRETNRQIICPVRAGSELAAIERGRNRLVELVGSDGAAIYAPRVRWLRADIEERQLGWNDRQWHEIATDTCEIFHCAASVSFDLPLDQAQRINVDGTIHIFDLAQAAAARHSNFNRFHHVSTAYVAGWTDGRVTADYVPSDRAGNFRNTYERTKARAERYLRNAASSRVPVSIHRPSIIAGDTRTGRTTNWNVLYVPMKMAARGALPIFGRGGRELVDSIGVDFLVDAMIAFSQLDAKPLESHHLTAGPTVFTLSDLISTAIDRAKLHEGYTPSQTRLLGPVAWRAVTTAVAITARLPKRVGTVRKKARIAQRSLDQCSVYLPYTRVNTIFDAGRDHDVLRVFGIEMPGGLDYLETITEYALATKFGKAVTGEHQVVAA